MRGASVACDAMAARIPTYTDEVTAAWVTDVLREGSAIGEAPVLETAVQVGAGVGIMGELFRVALTYDVADLRRAARVVVKLPSPTRPTGPRVGPRDVRGRGPLLPRAGRSHAAHAEGLLRRHRQRHGRLRDGDGGPRRPDHGRPDRGHVGRRRPSRPPPRSPACTADGGARSRRTNWRGSRASSTNASMAWPACGPTCGTGSRPSSPTGCPTVPIAVGDRVATDYWTMMTTLGERPWTLLHQDYRVENLFSGTTRSW